MATKRKATRAWPVERVGALLMSGIFVHGGWQAFNEPGGRSAKAAKLGLPQPQTLVRVNGLAMALGGCGLALGIKHNRAALVLIGSLIPTTIAGHAFWDEDEPRAPRMQETQFLKNLGLVGGLLLLAANPD